jgi:phenylacetate-CoA ligase
MYSHNVYLNNSILTTSFINDSFLLLKYQVNDTIEIINKTCICGRDKFAKLIDGRSDDFIISKSGKRIRGMDLPFKTMEGIYMAQIIQNDYAELLVNIIPNSRSKLLNTDKLLLRLKCYLGDEFDIKINFISESGLLLTPNGKCKLVVSFL